jgi:hypothetical protein
VRDERAKQLSSGDKAEVLTRKGALLSPLGKHHSCHFSYEYL